MVVGWESVVEACWRVSSGLVKGMERRECLYLVGGIASSHRTDSALDSFRCGVDVGLGG